MRWTKRGALLGAGLVLFALAPYGIWLWTQGWHLPRGDETYTVISMLLYFVGMPTSFLTELFVDAVYRLAGDYVLGDQLYAYALGVIVNWTLAGMGVDWLITKHVAE